MMNEIPLVKKKRHLLKCPFESYRVTGYLANMIRSGMYRFSPVTLISMAWEIIGPERVSSMLLAAFPEIAHVDDPDFVPHAEKDDDFDLPRALYGFLSGDIMPLLVTHMQKTAPCAARTETARRLGVLQSTFGLSGVEMEIIAFCFILATSSLMIDHFNRYREVDFSDIHSFSRHGHVVMGITASDLRDAMSNGTLFCTDILRNHHVRGLGLSPWAVDYLRGSGRSVPRPGIFQC